MGQKIKETKTKRCLNCGKLMRRGYDNEAMKLESVRDWNRRKFCSRKCSGIYSWKKRQEKEMQAQKSLVNW